MVLAESLVDSDGRSSRVLFDLAPSDDVVDTMSVTQEPRLKDLRGRCITNIKGNFIFFDRIIGAELTPGRIRWARP
jgi:hypothetical protein